MFVLRPRLLERSLRSVWNFAANIAWCHEPTQKQWLLSYLVHVTTCFLVLGSLLWGSFHSEALICEGLEPLGGEIQQGRTRREEEKSWNQILAWGNDLHCKHGSCELGLLSGMRFRAVECPLLCFLFRTFSRSVRVSNTFREWKNPEGHLDFAWANTCVTIFLPLKFCELKLGHSQF